MKKLTASRTMIISALLLAGILGVGYHREMILDRYALATVTPQPELVPLIQRLKLTDQGKAALYRSQARLEDKAAFNVACQTERAEIELGCYFRGRIYILKITNPDLASEMATVTAHEALHALWDRLSPKEQARLGAELQTAYEGLDDPALRDRMALYARTEPGQQANELHSILGTEYARLSPELERYYQRAFTDRQAVVAEHARYEAVFAERRSQLDDQLASIRDLKAQLADVNARLAVLEARGQLEAYSSLIPRQNALVDRINRLVGSYRSAVDEYNALSKSLDSTQIDPQIP